MLVLEVKGVDSEQNRSKRSSNANLGVGR